LSYEAITSILFRLSIRKILDVCSCAFHRIWSVQGWRNAVIVSGGQKIHPCSRPRLLLSRTFTFGFEAAGEGGALGMLFFLRVEGREGVVVWVVRGEFRVLAYLDDGAALVAVEEFLAWHFWRIRLFLNYRVICLCVAVCGLWGVSGRG
jgi:hypothetical protein